MIVHILDYVVETFRKTIFHLELIIVVSVMPKYAASHTL